MRALVNLVLFYIIAVLLWRNQAIDTCEQFKITDYNKCSSTEGMFRTLYELSLSECAFECDVRRKCDAINYRRRRLQCELLEHSNSSTEFKPTEFVPNSDQTGPCVYIHRKNIYINARKKFCGDNCTDGEVCNPTTGECIIKECHPLSLANGTIWGNMLNVGSRLKTKCSDGFAEVCNNVYTTCNSSGRWYPTIRCESTDCGAGWKYYDRSCYLFHNEKNMTNTEAQEFCEGNSSTLVFIQSAEENDFLIKLAKDAHEKGKYGNYWIGLKNSTGNAFVRIISGRSENATFFSWEDGQPDQLDTEHCVELRLDVSSYKWNNLQCYKPRQPLCERELCVT